MTVTRIGLIGDVHAEHQRLAAAITHLQELEAEVLICTGDIVDGTGCPDTSIDLLRSHQVRTVRGNHDRWVLEGKARHITDAHKLDDLSESSREYLEALPVQLDIDTIDGRLLLCHGVGDNDLRKVWPGTERMGVERSRELDRIIESEQYRYLINGHMHFRTMIHFESLTLINAGTLRGEHWPGFSLLDLADRQVTAFEIRDHHVQHCRTQQLQEESHTIFGNTRDFNGGWEPVRLF